MRGSVQLLKRRERWEKTVKDAEDTMVPEFSVFTVQHAAWQSKSDEEKD